LAKFKYNKVPMGVKQSPDFAQEVVEDIFPNMEDVEVYIDAIGLWAQSWAHHQMSNCHMLEKGL
jgi:hypothetical protein